MKEGLNLVKERLKLMKNSLISDYYQKKIFRHKSHKSSLDLESTAFALMHRWKYFHE